MSKVFAKFPVLVPGLPTFLLFSLLFLLLLSDPSFEGQAVLDVACL